MAETTPSAPPVPFVQRAAQTRLKREPAKALNRAGNRPERPIRPNAALNRSFGPATRY